MTARDLAFTPPITLSQLDFGRVRELLVEAVAKIAQMSSRRVVCAWRSSIRADSESSQ